jgi:hypothetical protein
MANLSCHHHSHRFLCHHRAYPYHLLVCRVPLYDRGHDRRGFGIDPFHDLGRGLGHGLGHAYHSLGHAGHLCVESNQHVRDEEKASGRGGVEIVHDGLVDHGRNRNARMQMGECEPTTVELEKQEGVSFGVSYFNLQQVITSDPLIMHLVVRIVCIATTLIFDKRKAGLGQENDIEHRLYGMMTSELTDD